MPDVALCPVQTRSASESLRRTHRTQLDHCSNLQQCTKVAEKSVHHIGNVLPYCCESKRVAVIESDTHMRSTPQAMLFHSTPGSPAGVHMLCISLYSPQDVLATIRSRPSPGVPEQQRLEATPATVCHCADDRLGPSFPAADISRPTAHLAHLFVTLNL